MVAKSQGPLSAIAGAALWAIGSGALLLGGYGLASIVARRLAQSVLPFFIPQGFVWSAILLMLLLTLSGPAAVLIIGLRKRARSMIAGPLLLLPIFAGYWLTSGWFGRSEMLVGRNAVAAHATIVPISVHPRPECVTDSETDDWWGSHYDQITISMDCALPANMAHPRMFDLHIDGAETLMDPEYARTGIADPYDIRPADAYEVVLPRSPLPGYTAISEVVSDKNLLTNTRFIAISDVAMVKVLNCLVVWKKLAGAYEVDRGSCDGFGHYRTILFDARFQLRTGDSEKEISDPIRHVIDGIIAPQH